MKGPTHRSHERGSKSTQATRRRTQSPSKQPNARDGQTDDATQDEKLVPLEQEFCLKYQDLNKENQLNYLDEVYLLVKKIPFLQSRSKEDIRKITLKTRDIEIANEESRVSRQMSKSKQILIAAIEACLESAHVYLAKEEHERFSLSLEKCSKILVLLGVDQPLHPVLLIKYDLLRCLAPSTSESNRFHMLQSLLIRLQSQPKMEYITGIVHLLLNLAYYRIEGKLSYNHIKNASSFFVRRLGLSAETKLDVPDPELYLLTRKLNLSWREQQEAFSVSAACILLMELCLRIQMNERFGDSANLSRKCNFYVSCLSRPMRKLLQPNAHRIMERMEDEQKIQQIRDPDFGKPNRALYRNTLAKQIQVSVNRVRDEPTTLNMPHDSGVLRVNNTKSSFEQELLLVKSAEPRSEEDLRTLARIESKIPIFPGVIDEEFMAKYSIPQEFIKGNRTETSVRRPKKRKNDLFRQNVMFDWNGNPRWINSKHDHPPEELDIRKHSIPSQIDDHNQLEHEETISVDQELDKLVGLISKEKLNNFGFNYIRQSTQRVRRRFTINTMVSAKPDSWRTSRVKLNNKLTKLSAKGISSDKRIRIISQEKVNKKSATDPNLDANPDLNQYRGMSSFFYKETFRKNPEFMFSQRPSEINHRSVPSFRLNRSDQTKPLPDFITSIKGLGDGNLPKKMKTQVPPEKPAEFKRQLRGETADLNSGISPNTDIGLDLQKTRRKSLSHRVTSVQGIGRTVTPPTGLGVQSIPPSEPFLQSEIEELQALLTLAERRTTEDLMTKRNPTKAKRLLRKAIGFISIFGSKAHQLAKAGEQPSEPQPVSPIRAPGRFESAMMRAQSILVDKSKDRKYATSKQSSRSQLNNSLVHWADQLNREHKTPRLSHRKMSSSGTEAKIPKSERLMSDSQDHSMVKSFTKPTTHDFMVHALVSPQHKPSKWGVLKRHLINKQTGEIEVSNLLRRLSPNPTPVAKGNSNLAFDVEQRKSSMLNVGSKSETSQIAESASVKISKKTSSKKDSASHHPTSVTEEAARRKQKGEKKKLVYKEHMSKLVSAIKKLKSKRYVYMFSKLKMNWVTARTAEIMDQSCPPRIYPHTSNPPKGVRRRVSSQVISSTRRNLGGFTLQNEEIYSAACFVSQNVNRAVRMRFELKQQTNKNEPIELGLREEPHQYVIRLDLDNEKLHGGKSQSSRNKWRALCEFLKQRLGGLDPNALKSIQVVLPPAGFKNEQSNKKLKLLLSLLTLLVSEKYMIVQKHLGYKVVPKINMYAEISEIRDLLKAYFDRITKDLRSLVIPEIIEPIGYSYMKEVLSPPTDEAVKFLGAKVKSRNKFFELNRTAQDPGYFHLDESMEARRNQIKKKEITVNLQLKPLNSTDSIIEEKLGSDNEPSVELLPSPEIRPKILGINKLKDRTISSPDIGVLHVHPDEAPADMAEGLDFNLSPAIIPASLSADTKKGKFFNLQIKQNELAEENRIDHSRKLHDVIEEFEFDEKTPSPVNLRRKKSGIFQNQGTTQRRSVTKIVSVIPIANNLDEAETSKHRY